MGTATPDNSFDHIVSAYHEMSSRLREIQKDVRNLSREQITEDRLTPIESRIEETAADFADALKEAVSKEKSEITADLVGRNLSSSTLAPSYFKAAEARATELLAKAEAEATRLTDLVAIERRRADPTKV